MNPFLIRIFILVYMYTSIANTCRAVEPLYPKPRVPATSSDIYQLFLDIENTYKIDVAFFFKYKKLDWTNRELVTDLFYYAISVAMEYEDCRPVKFEWSLEILDLFFLYGFNSSHLDPEQYEPIQHMIASGNSKNSRLLDYLAQRGFVLNNKDSKEVTLRDWAEKNGSLNTLRFIDSRIDKPPQSLNIFTRCKRRWVKAQ